MLITTKVGKKRKLEAINATNQAMDNFCLIVNERTESNEDLLLGIQPDLHSVQFRRSIFVKLKTQIKKVTKVFQLKYREVFPVPYSHFIDFL